jgi:hypothetical protein
MVDRGGSVVVLKGELPVCALVAIWIREHVVTELSLAFFDEDYTASVVLAERMTAEELVSKFELGLFER